MAMARRYRQTLQLWNPTGSSLYLLFLFNKLCSFCSFPGVFCLTYTPQECTDAHGAQYGSGRVDCQLVRRDIRRLRLRRISPYWV